MPIIFADARFPETVIAHSCHPNVILKSATKHPTTFRGVFCCTFGYFTELPGRV